MTQRMPRRLPSVPDRGHGARPQARPADRRSLPRRARHRSRAATAAPPPPPHSVLPETDDAAFQAGLLDEDFDHDDPMVGLLDTIALARRLRNEEDETARFC